MSPENPSADAAMLERVRSCMARALKLEASAASGIDRSTTAGDLPGWTSVGHLSLVLELETAFGVTFGNDEIVSMGSVAAITDRLNDKTRTRTD